MEGLKPPKTLSFEGNVSENWRRWIQQFRLYLNATGKDKKSEEVQCSTLLTIAGEDAVEIFNTFVFAESEVNKIDVLIQKFEQYCTPKKNVTFERHVFNTRNQGPGEGIDAYVTELKKMAKTCEFGELKDSLIKDRIVCGIHNADVKARLLREADLTLDKALTMCRTAELSTSQLKNIVEGGQEHVAAIYRNPRNIERKRLDREKEQSSNSCSKCGLRHPLGQCFAFGKTCRKCNKPNHFARMCKMKTNSNRGINAISQESDVEDSDNEGYFVGAVDDMNTTQKNGWNVETEINDKNVTFKLDTGAQCNVMSAKLYYELSKEKPKRPATRLVSYSGHKMKTVGKNTLLVSYKHKFHPVEFQIVEHSGAVPVLGLNTCLEMELIKRVYTVNTDKENKVDNETPAESIMKEFDDVFKGIGCFDGHYHIKIDKAVIPVIHPPRKVPFALKQRLKTELDRMETIGVITKVTQPTEWVNSIVVNEKKNGDVRVCLDPRDLNKAIRREHYPMKTVEEVATELSGATVFSTLDASSGFWHVQLDDPSSMLTTFNTPFGRYRFLRMPFGINSSSEVFQRKMTQSFEDIDGSESIVDDILIWGKDEEEHNQRLRQVLQRARDINLKLNAAKSKIQTSEVTYMGHIISKDGLKPDPTKIQAIKDIQTPKDKKELQRFIGMVNYLGKFIPNLSEKTQPLRELLKKEIEWHWSDVHDAAFNRLKESLISDTTLKYYDVTKPVTISVDSSSYGLGACLLQEGHPISYASRSLNETESNYAQIEKELLAIHFGCQKFHQFIYGKPVTIETDHKPLEYLFKKPLFSAPPRLQRMMLSLQKYELYVNYKPGKTLFIADTLSRAPGAQTENSGQSDEQFYVHTIQNLPITAPKIDEFKVETEKDEALQSLKRVVKTGWPEDKGSVEPIIREYWSVRHEISEQEGLLLRGERLVVPSTLRAEMLQKLHENHLGIEKCKRRARDILYWPGMNDQITQTVSRCETCAVYKKAQRKEPMKGHDVPDRPWQKVSMDLFELDKEQYIVITDYYSKYFEVSNLSGTTAMSTIKHIKPHFARHGIPEEVISDNGPQFSSKEFQDFATKYGFKHTTSSPRYAQSNGQAERTVQTVKDVLTKAKHDKKDPNLALLDLRNTPIDGIGKSPVQILFGRRTRTRLPTRNTLLQPLYDTEKIKASLEQRQDKQKFYYDQHVKPLTPLAKGDRVGIKDEKKGVWRPAIVTQQLEQPRSYKVESEGVEYRRNRRDLLKLPDETENQPKPLQDHGPISSENPEHMPATNEQPQSLTMTRSGRIIRPPDRFV